MEILILPIAFVVCFYLLFKEDKSGVTKLREALKDTSIKELKFVKELINNEIKSRKDKV